MPYCITLRSRNRCEGSPVGMAGRNCRWSTDRPAPDYGSITRTMPVPFAKNCAACCPRNTSVINHRTRAKNDPHVDVGPPRFSHIALR